MSFILDALRKSELERQRDAAARVMRIPVAQHAGVRVPAWVTALIVVLVVSVVVLAGTAWRGWHKRAAAVAAAAASGAAAQPETAARPKETAPAAAPTAEPRKPTAQAAAAGKRGAALAAAQSSRKPVSAAPASAGTRTAKRPASQARQPPAPPADPAALPSVDELAADGVHVPALTLQLHVYSKDPSHRFVFINGTRYQEGQRTEEGPVLVSVTPKGAVLSEQGREFFLPIQ